MMLGGSAQDFEDRGLVNSSSNDSLTSKPRMLLAARDSDIQRARAHIRALHVREQVGAEAATVRSHMSHLFEPDPTERWAEESSSGRGSNTHLSSLAAEVTEVAVNEGVVQTQSESAGNFDPLYEWLPWERALMARGRSTALIIYVVGSALIAWCAAMVT